MTMHPALNATLGLVIAAQLMACGMSAGAGAHPLERANRQANARIVATPLAPGVVTAAAPLAGTFTVAVDGEGLLDLSAHVPGSDWELLGRESATVRLSIDGRYNQDVVLAMGETPHTYQLALGALKAGSHTYRLERLKDFSAPGLLQIVVDGGGVSVVPPGSADYDAIANAPILVSRDTPHLTDTLMAMYYETASLPGGQQSLRYTPIFSNEDGGTATRALMARWGRTVDIDWAYTQVRDAQGKVQGETYHGWLHFTRQFKGQRENRHPLLQIASDNNIYSDDLKGPLRFRPAPLFRLDPEATAREAVLDEVPWAYELMVKELFRERKSARDFYNQPALQGGAIGDPRRFMFVEFKQASDGRGVGVAVKLKSMPDTFYSNRGDKGLQAERNGWCRVAVELPRAITQDDLERIDLMGLGGGSATVTAVRQVMVLDAEFKPRVFPITWEGEGALRRDQDRVTVYGIKAIPPADRPQ